MPSTNPYFDTGFLLTLLIQRPGTVLATDVMQQFSPPFSLHLLHQLQTESFFGRGEHTPQKQIARDGARLWRRYWSEGVFRVVLLDWHSALRIALNWNKRFVSESPPPPLLLLHPALAAVSGATHFYSFDPRSRSLAKVIGLHLAPERL